MVAGGGIRVRSGLILPAGVVIFFIASCLVEMSGEFCVLVPELSFGAFLRPAEGKPSGVCV